jgi:hypothetical protein
MSNIILNFKNTILEKREGVFLLWWDYFFLYKMNGGTQNSKGREFLL